MEKIKNLKQYFNKDKHIIFKYIAAKFWGPFLFSLGVFAVLVFVADTFENMNVFVKSSTGFFAVAKYLILTIPYWVLTIMPAACLLGCLFVISDMISSGEWLASIASGYSIKQIFIPISGKTELKIKDNNHEKKIILQKKNIAVLVPNLTWCSLKFLDNNSVVMVACDRKYEYNDYIEKYSELLKIFKKK